MFGRLFSKEKKESLDKGLKKTQESFFGRLGKAIAGKSTVDDEVLDNLEEVLVASDVGVQVTLKIIERIGQRVAKDKYLGTTELDRILKEEIAGLLSENNTADLTDFNTPQGVKPYVVMVVGVNGVGKTTNIFHALCREQLQKIILFDDFCFTFTNPVQYRLEGNSSVFLHRTYNSQRGVSLEPLPGHPRSGSA